MKKHPVELSREELLFLVEKAPLVSIDLIVRSPDHRILLGRRINQPAQSYWFVPGGRIRKAETIDAAFRRICTEELGSPHNLSEAQFWGSFEHFYDENFAEVPDFGTHYVVLAYALDVPAGIDLSKLPRNQHSKFQWFETDGLRDRKDIHENSKLFFTKMPATPEQYQLVAARHTSLVEMMWQSPIVSLTAQAFLFTIIFDSGVRPIPQLLAAFLALITSIGSIQLMAKHRYNEVVDRRWLEDFERQRASEGYSPVNAWLPVVLDRNPDVSYVKRWIDWKLAKYRSYYVWLAILATFLLIALAMSFFAAYRYGMSLSLGGEAGFWGSR